MIDWHRLFGLALSDLFHGSPWSVELEKDLSLKKQLLDVIILRRGPGKFEGRLPDGLEDLAPHNLLTYKSLHEPLDAWSLHELIGHYVNYRKVIAATGEMPPEEDFQLYGIATRFPQKLAGQTELTPRAAGVYEALWGPKRIVVVVLNQIAPEEHNSLWNLFSGVPDTVRFGAGHYEPKSDDTSSVFNRLFETYNLEGLTMPYTIEDFKLDLLREKLHLLTPKQRLEGLTVDERLEGLSVDALLEGLSPEEIDELRRKLKSKENGDSGPET